MKLLKFIALSSLFVSTLSFAGEADVLNVNVSKTSNGHYNFDVRVKHNDEGWKHYVNKWDVVTTDGQVIATRVLHHPHVNEQPFTRSIHNVDIPNDISSIVIRAHDSVHQYGGREIHVNLAK